MHVLCPSIRKKTPTIQPRKKPKTKRNWKYIWCGIIARSAILEKPSSTGQERKTPCTGLQLAKVKSPWNLGALCTEFPVLYSWTGSTVLWQMIKLVFKWSVGGRGQCHLPQVDSALLENRHVCWEYPHFYSKVGREWNTYRGERQLLLNTAVTSWLIVTRECRMDWAYSSNLAEEYSAT